MTHKPDIIILTENGLLIKITHIYISLIIIFFINNRILSNKKIGGGVLILVSKLIGSTKEFFSRIAKTTASLTKLNPIWNDRNLTLKYNILLLHSLVSSIFLYACETWTISKELQRRITAMDFRCLRILLKISYKDRITNKEVRN